MQTATLARPSRRQAVAKRSPRQPSRCEHCGQHVPADFDPTSNYESIRIRGSLHFFTRAQRDRIARLIGRERLTAAEVKPLADHPAFDQLAEGDAAAGFTLAGWISA